MIVRAWKRIPQPGMVFAYLLILTIAFGVTWSQERDRRHDEFKFCELALISTQHSPSVSDSATPYEHARADELNRFRDSERRELIGDRTSC